MEIKDTDPKFYRSKYCKILFSYFSDFIPKIHGPFSFGPALKKQWRTNNGKQVLFIIYLI